MDYFFLEVGNDVKKEKWMDINDKLKIYVSYF